MSRRKLFSGLHAPKEVTEEKPTRSVMRMNVDMEDVDPLLYDAIFMRLREIPGYHSVEFEIEIADGDNYVLPGNLLRADRLVMNSIFEHDVEALDIHGSRHCQIDLKDENVAKLHNELRPRLIDTLGTDNLVLIDPNLSETHRVIWEGVNDIQRSYVSAGDSLTVPSLNFQYIDIESIDIGRTMESGSERFRNLVAQIGWTSRAYLPPASIFFPGDNTVQAFQDASFVEHTLDVYTTVLRRLPGTSAQVIPHRPLQLFGVEMVIDAYSFENTEILAYWITVDNERRWYLNTSHALIREAIW